MTDTIMYLGRHIVLVNDFEYQVPRYGCVYANTKINVNVNDHVLSHRVRIHRTQLAWEYADIDHRIQSICYINLYSSNTNTKYMYARQIGSTFIPRTRNEPRLGSAQGYCTQDTINNKVENKVIQERTQPVW